MSIDNLTNTPSDINPEIPKPSAGSGKPRCSRTKKLVVLLIALACCCLLTFAARLCFKLPNRSLTKTASVIFNLYILGVGVGASIITGHKPDFDWKNCRQYIIGIIIALCLSGVIAFMPPLAFGFSLVGNHSDFDTATCIYELWHYLFIIGPVEEFFFREYVQETLIDLLPSCKWAGVLIASAIFGLWHLINGSIVQVFFTFGIGCVFGFSKYLIKNCKCPGLALGHGLYDFLNYIVCCFIL